MAQKKDVQRLAEEEILIKRQQNYIATFDKESPTARAVLSDLAKFCRASESTFDIDPRVHALREGRREVWLRITENLDLSSQDLWELKTGTKF